MGKQVLRYRCWIVLAAAVGINLTMGVNYSWSVIEKALVTNWHWTNVQASLPYTVYTPALALSMFFAGRLQDRLGPRLVASIGGLCLGTGLISCGFVHTPRLMVLTYGLAGIGNGLCYSTTIPTCIKWFSPERKGLITGIVVSAVAIAAAYFSPIANWLLGSFGISAAFRIFGGAAFIILMIMSQFLGNPPKATGEAPSPKRKPVRQAPDMDWRQMVRTPVFYQFWLVFFLAASAGLMIMAHITTIAFKQADWQYGFYLVILFALSNTAGRMSAGLLADKYDFLKIMKVVLLLQAVNLVLFSVYIHPLLLALGTVLTGFCYGSVFSLISYGAAEYYGIKNLGGNYGLLYTAWGFSGFLGPLLAGRVVDLTGRYLIAYLVSAGLLLVALLLAATIRPRVERSAQASA